MEDKDVIGSDSNDYNYNAQMRVWEIGDLQYVMINDHRNWNTHQYIGQTYNSKEDTLHVEGHVTWTRDKQPSH